jgi:hypothetical protein
VEKALDHIVGNVLQVIAAHRLDVLDGGFDGLFEALLLLTLAQPVNELKGVGQLGGVDLRLFGGRWRCFRSSGGRVCRRLKFLQQLGKIVLLVRSTGRSTGTLNRIIGGGFGRLLRDAVFHRIPLGLVY